MKKEFAAVSTTVVVILILILAESAFAVHVGISGISSTTPTEGSAVTFTAYVDVDTGERIPVTNLTLTIGSESCVFDVDGNEISGLLCSKITISKNNAATLNTGARWGYDYEAGVNHTWASGQGYARTAGYDYSAAPYGELSYDITWTTPSVSSNTGYTATLTARSDESVTYAKTFTNFVTVQNAASGSSSSSKKKVTKYISKITPGGVEIVKFMDRSLGIKQISITVDNTNHNVQISVEKLDGKPASVSKVNRAYQYFEVKKSNLDNLTEAEMQFEVTKKWLMEQGLDKSEISLYHYTNRWEQLRTRFVEETSSGYIYEATTPGFSYFVVAEGEASIEGSPVLDSSNSMTGQVTEPVIEENNPENMDNAGLTIPEQTEVVPQQEQIDSEPQEIETTPEPIVVDNSNKITEDDGNKFSPIIPIVIMLAIAILIAVFILIKKKKTTL